MVDPVAPRRDQLAAITGGDYRLLIALERLFEVAGSLTPDQLATIQADVDQNALDIAANALGIATNTADISTNAAAIAANAGNIATNTADIATNAAAIAALEAQVSSFDVQLAEAQILTEYGDVASVLAKSKTLQKFGASDTIGTTIATVWNVGADNETYVTANVIDTVSSTDATDTQTFAVEGHTVTGSGASAEYTFVVQDVTLNGQSKVTLGTSLARVSRMYNTSAADNAGNVAAYQDQVISGGAPTDLTKTHCQVDAGQNQSAKAATTISNQDYLIISAVYGSVVEKSSASVDFSLEVRAAGGQFQVKRFFSATNTSGLAYFPVQPYLIVPKNGDVRVRALASAANTSVSAGFDGYLALVS